MIFFFFLEAEFRTEIILKLRDLKRLKQVLFPKQRCIIYFPF